MDSSNFGFAYDKNPDPVREKSNKFDYIKTFFYYLSDKNLYEKSTDR